MCSLECKAAQLLLEPANCHAISAVMMMRRGSLSDGVEGLMRRSVVSFAAIVRGSLSPAAAGIFVLGAAASGCAGANANPQTPSPTYVPPQQCSDAVPAPGVPEGEKSEGAPMQEEPVSALPRYFTVELSAGVTFANGVRVSADELARVVSREAGDTRNQGAAVVVDSRVDGSRLLRVFGQLSAAGFSHIVFSGLPEDAVLGALGLDSGSLVVAAPPATTDTEPVAEPEPEETSSLEVKTIGLHVGGGPNDSETRGRYVAIIESKLAEFKKCHLLTPDTNKKASFGVDLLLPTKGGRPKVKDYRTSLKGRDFQACVLGTFGQIRFPEVPRPTVISYSLLFKPNAR